MELMPGIHKKGVGGVACLPRIRQGLVVGEAQW